MSEAVAAPAPSTPAAPPAAPASPPAEGETPAQNTAEQAPATAPEGEKPDTGQDPEKQSKRRFERRLDRAYRKAAEAEARAQFFEKQFQEARARSAPQEDPAAPKLENFKDIEEYAKAVGKYESDKAVRAFNERQRVETQKQAQERLMKSWEAKVERALEKYEDFHDLVGDIKPTSAALIAVMEADNGDEIAYYLAKHPEEARKIGALPPTAQIREIGKLEARLAAEPAKPKTPSKAPAPINPVTGSTPVSAKSIYDPDLSYSEFVKLRNKQLGRK